MVKAPRSKGCRVCVQRRIKCDLTKPHCLRCQRANRECPGFETTKFVDEGPTLKQMYDTSSKDPSRERASSPAASSSSSSSSSAGEGTIPIRRARKSASSSPGHGQTALTPINADNWQAGAFESSAMISIICPNVYQNQLLADFIESVRQPTDTPTFRCHSMWLREVAIRTAPSAALTWAIRAISIAHLGRMTADASLIETSRRVYGKALLKLNAALQDSVEGLSSDTLSATILLSFYEVFNCTDRHSWIKHAGGAGHLIRLRGPARHRTGIDRAVFITCRYSLLMEAFQNRTPCFLDAPEWRQLGWDLHNDHMRDRTSPHVIDTNEAFFQEMVTHPAYLRAAIDAVADPAPAPTTLHTLLTRGQHHRTAFQVIHAQTVRDLRAAGDEPSKTASSVQDTTFPVVYDYPSIHVAAHFCGYWAILCALNISIIGLQAKIAKLYDSTTAAPLPKENLVTLATGVQQAVPAPLPLETRPLWEAAHTMGNQHLYLAENAAYAREICKSAEYMQQTPFVGPLFLILSLRMAVRMSITDQEKEWILGKLRVIGENMGLAKTEIDMYRSQRDESGGEWGAQQERGRGPDPEAAGGKGTFTFVEEPGLESGKGSGTDRLAMGEAAGLAGELSGSARGDAGSLFGEVAGGGRWSPGQGQDSRGRSVAGEGSERLVAELTAAGVNPGGKGLGMQWAEWADVSGVGGGENEEAWVPERDNVS